MDTTPNAAVPTGPTAKSGPLGSIIGEGNRYGQFAEGWIGYTPSNVEDTTMGNEEADYSIEGNEPDEDTSSGQPTGECGRLATQAHHPGAGGEAVRTDGTLADFIGDAVPSTNPEPERLHASPALDDGQNNTMDTTRTV